MMRVAFHGRLVASIDVHVCDEDCRIFGCEAPATSVDDVDVEEDVFDGDPGECEMLYDRY